MSRPLAELMSGARKIRAVPIAAAEIDALVAADPFYEKAVVRLTLNTALSQTGLIEALGVKMSLVASCDMPEREVYRVTKATFERLEALRKINPTISLMSFEAMVKNLPSPVHPGAMTYYRESGLNPTLRP